MSNTIIHLSLSTHLGHLKEKLKYLNISSYSDLPPKKSSYSARGQNCDKFFIELNSHFTQQANTLSY